MSDDLTKRVEQIHAGGAEKYHEKNKGRGKLFVRDRLAILFDDNTEFVEEGQFANHTEDALAADGVVTGFGIVHGRKVAVIANDSTIKAGSWGPLTVEKIIRQQELAMRMKVPLVYLVDSAGARIDTQVDMFPGRRGAGKIFYNQVQASGMIPQICGLFGPSAAGGAYIPAFCDVVIMVDKNASMYLGSPRMAEMVVFEKATLEEMGGAKMHTGVSGCGDVLVKTEPDCLAKIRDLLALMPDNYEHQPPAAEATAPELSDDIAAVIPADENKPFDMFEVVNRLIDAGSFWEVKKRFAKELITGFARIGGRVIGIVANQPRHLGGTLFVDSADKGTRFIQLCDAFNVPLLFLADVPGFMIGTKVERQGIIRHGAKMIFAVSQARVPKISVVVRKAYGAGLYAMSGPGFEPDATIALPSAMIAVMGPEAAVNAVYFNKIQAKPEAEREAYVEELRAEYREDVDIYKLASKLVIDDIVEPAKLRDELIERFEAYAGKDKPYPLKKHGVMPV